MSEPRPGFIVVLNGAPRSGKSNIADEIQKTFEGVWMNLGADVYIRHVTPPQFRPGIGLRPGGERPDLEPLLPMMYAALYESAAAHSRLGLNVVMDLAHHDSYTAPKGILADCARRVAGLPAVLVGVRCPIETILQRRNKDSNGSERSYLKATDQDPLPLPIVRWQEEVHRPGIYDLELDTSRRSPSDCARTIASLLSRELPRPTAFEILAQDLRPAPE